MFCVANTYRIIIRNTLPIYEFLVTLYSGKRYAICDVCISRYGFENKLKNNKRSLNVAATLLKISNANTFFYNKGISIVKNDRGLLNGICSTNSGGLNKDK